MRLNGIPVKGYCAPYTEPKNLFHCYLPSHDVPLFSENENAYAAAQGTVKSVLTIPGAGCLIIVVMPDDFFAVYSNFQTISVTKGQTIYTGQLLGKLLRDERNNNLYLLNFQLWEVKGVKCIPFTQEAVEDYLYTLQESKADLECAEAVQQ